MTAERHTIVTDVDRNRLHELTKSLRAIGRPYRDHATMLESELSRADITPRDNVGADVVTMNSFVRILDLRTRKTEELTIVYPQDSDIFKGRVSVLAPLAMALLGTRVGETVEIRVPAGVRKLRVEEILYQPEAAGDRHL